MCLIRRICSSSLCNLGGGSWQSKTNVLIDRNPSYLFLIFTLRRLIQCNVAIPRRRRLLLARSVGVRTMAKVCTLRYFPAHSDVLNPHGIIDEPKLTNRCFALLYLAAEECLLPVKVTPVDCKQNPGETISTLLTPNKQFEQFVRCPPRPFLLLLPCLTNIKTASREANISVTPFLLDHDEPIQGT